MTMSSIQGYIIIWRQSPSARYLDVRLTDGSGSASGEIAVFNDEPTVPLIDSEDSLISYINSEDTSPRAVDAELAHRVLGWSIP